MKELTEEEKDNMCDCELDRHEGNPMMGMCFMCTGTIKQNREIREEILLKIHGAQKGCPFDEDLYNK